MVMDMSMPPADTSGDTATLSQHLDTATQIPLNVTAAPIESLRMSTNSQIQMQSSESHPFEC